MSDNIKAEAPNKEEVSKKDEPKQKEAEPKSNTTSATANNLKIQKKETIEVEKDQLTALLDSNKSLTERLERVESAANKALLAKYDSQHQKDKQKVVSLLQYDGMTVKSWSNMLKNRVEKNVQSKVWEEEQIIEVHFFDIDKPIQMHYVQFNQNYTKIPAVVKKETILNNEEAAKYGDRMFEVETKEGKTYEIGKKFVN